MLRVTCSCGKSLTTDEKYAGRRAKCPKCGGDVTFPGLVTRGVDLPPEKNLPESPAPPVKRPRTILSNSRVAVFGGIAVTVLVIMTAYTATQFPRKSGDATAKIAVRADKPIAKTVASEQLAVVDVPSITTPLVQGREQESSRFRMLIEKAASVHTDGEEGVRRGIQQMIADAKENGFSLSPEEAVEGSLRWPMPGYFSRVENPEFSDYVQMYKITGMKVKTSHKDRIRQLHRLASALHVVGESVSDDSFNAAYMEASPGCQLAMVESLIIIRPDDPLAEYYQSLAEHVGRLYNQPANLIGASVAYVISQIKLAKKSGHPAEILDAATEWPPLLEAKRTGEQAPNFGKFLVEYYETRTNRKLGDDATISELNR